MSAVLITHALATAMMAGVIWIVQLVQYPLLAEVGSFRPYHQGHMRRITWVVAPLMLAELVAAVWLVVARSGALPLAGLALLAIAWGTTAFVSVPLHRSLSNGFSEAAHRRLVASNWLRTAAWSARLVVAAALLWGPLARAAAL